MKIMFCGCSMVLGDEIERDERFSYLVSEQLNATEWNISQGGRSNIMSVVLTITEAMKERPDYIVFGITYPHRAVGIRADIDDVAAVQNKIADWNADDIFEMDTDKFFKLVPMMGSYIHKPPNYKELEQSFSVFRHTLQTHIETLSVINLLFNFADENNIPLCVFPAVTLFDHFKKINDVTIANSVLDYPINSKYWMNTNIYEMAESNNDMMPQDHPGAKTNREFADLLVARIKKDLNL